MANLDPPPVIAPIAEGRQELMSGDWIRWILNSVFGVLSNTATVFPQRVTLTSQSASIGITTIPLPLLVAGTYQVGYYARITQPDGVSSSLTTTFHWTESAIPLQISGPAMTGDTTTTVQSGLLPLVVDGNTAISYATTYASNTPGSMKYRLSAFVQGPL